MKRAKFTEMNLLKAQEKEEVYIGRRRRLKQTGSGVFYLSLEIFLVN